MTQEVMWSLLVTLGAIAVAAVLDSVAQRRTLHLMNKETTSEREQLDSLKKQYDKTISDLKEFHAAEIENLSRQIPHVAHGERLKELREKILVIVSQHDRLHDAEIAAIAGVSKQLATLHLHELRSAKLVRSSFGLDDDSYEVPVWFLEHQGRQYLSDNGLL